MGSSKVKNELKTKKANKAQEEAITKEAVSETAQKQVITQVKHDRSKSYQHFRSQVDRTKYYTPINALTLLKKISRQNHPTITADILYKDEKFSGELSFPHSTGKSIKVAIIDDLMLETIAKGKIDFDILLAKPDYMPKLAKLAKILGPKGLMPNPKNNTLTKDPQKRKAELEKGQVNLKTEKSAPLIHVQIGKIDQPEQELLDNLQALVKAVNPHKIAKLVISSTMSPGIKVDISGYIAT